MTKMRYFKKKGGGWSRLNCAHGRTFTGNCIIPGFCEAKRAPFLVQTFSLKEKLYQKNSKKEKVL